MVKQWVRACASFFLILMVVYSFFPLHMQIHTIHAEEDEVYLLIDKRINRLSVMLNDIPVYQFRVATGRSSRPTPVGTFRIVTKVVNPYYKPKKIAGGDKSNPLGSRWMGLDIGNGYKYGIHGTHKPHLIGQSVSSGCIRMNNRDIEFIFRHIPLRTKVIITGD